MSRGMRRRAAAWRQMQIDWRLQKTRKQKQAQGDEHCWNGS